MNTKTGTIPHAMTAQEYLANRRRTAVGTPPQPAAPSDALERPVYLDFPEFERRLAEALDALQAKGVAPEQVRFTLRIVLEVQGAR